MTSTPQQELAARGKRDSIPRYTVEQQSGTIYFRLVEDTKGAWVTFANHNALVTKLEMCIEKLAGATPEAAPTYSDLPLDPPLFVDGVETFNMFALVSFVLNGVRLRGKSVVAIDAKETTP